MQTQLTTRNQSQNQLSQSILNLSETEWRQAILNMGSLRLLADNERLVPAAYASAIIADADRYLAPCSPTQSKALVAKLLASVMTANRDEFETKARLQQVEEAYAVIPYSVARLSVDGGLGLPKLHKFLPTPAEISAFCKPHIERLQDTKAMALRHLEAHAKREREAQRQVVAADKWERAKQGFKLRPIQEAIEIASTPKPITNSSSRIVADELAARQTPQGQAEMQRRAQAALQEMGLEVA